MTLHQERHDQQVLALFLFHITSETWTSGNVQHTQVISIWKYGTFKLHLRHETIPNGRYLQRVL